MSKKTLVILLAVVIAGLAYLKFKPTAKGGVSEAKNGTGETSVRRTPPQKPQPGDKLADLSVAQFAFKVAPGELTSAGKTALTGWDIKTSTQKDGSITVVLVPNKTDDQKQSYTVPSGDSLYFVEMSTGDDNQQAGTDSRLQDDYGLIVNADGIVL